MRPPVERLIKAAAVARTHCRSMKFSHRGGRKIERRGIDVAENRPRAGPRDGAGGGEERERRGDHLIARTDAERHERQQQRIGARGHADAVRRAAISRDLRLEGAHVLAQDELLAFAHRCDDRHDLSADLRELGLKIE